MSFIFGPLRLLIVKLIEFRNHQFVFSGFPFLFVRRVTPFTPFFKSVFLIPLAFSSSFKVPDNFIAQEPSQYLIHKCLISFTDLAFGL